MRLSSRTRSTLRAAATSIVSLGALLPAASSCSSVAGDAEQVGSREQPLAGGGQQINRIIPLRFVQLTNNASALTASELQDDIDAANFIYAPAGVRFYLANDAAGLEGKANFRIPDQGDATFASLDGSYTWPTPTWFSLPIFAIDPGCAPPAPAGGSENELSALFRMGAHCSRDGEALVFIVDSASQDMGALPWQSNAVQMQRHDFTDPLTRVFAHELGHYLGLPHSFRGANLEADLGSCTVDPETGTAARISDFWDLVYQPSEQANVANRYFTSRSDAQSVALSSLRPIQGNSDWHSYPFGRPPLGFGCLSGSLEFGCGAQADGTLRLAIPRTTAEYADCNQDNDGAICLCANNPTACDLFYTGSGALKGLGFQMPGHTSANPKLGVNVMSYNYEPAGVYSGDEFWLSASQIEQIKRTLRRDINSALVPGCATWAFPGTTGRRHWLGTGRGRWSDWESLGGNLVNTPSVTATSAGQLDVFIRQSDNFAYNKVQNAGSTSWWPSQTGWSSIGSTFIDKVNATRRGGFLDVVGRSTDNGAWNKVWDPGLGAWWPSQTNWVSLGGTTLQVTPSIASWDTNRIDLVTRTTVNFHHKFWTGTTGTWSPSQTGWTSLGAPNGVSGYPSISTWGPNRLDVIGMGSNGSAFINIFSGSWSGWTGLGTQQFSHTPAVVAWGVNRLDVIGRGTDGRAYNKVWTGTSWWPSLTTWADIGGSVAGPISVATWGVGRLDIVARSSNNELLYKYWDQSTGAWWPAQTEWAVLGVDIGGDPVIATTGSDSLDIFVRGSDGALWHRSRRADVPATTPN